MNFDIKQDREEAAIYLNHAIGKKDAGLLHDAVSRMCAIDAYHPDIKSAQALIRSINVIYLPPSSLVSNMYIIP